VAGCRAWSRVSACSAQSVAGPRHWQWFSLLNVNGDQSVQRDKPQNGSSGEDPSYLLYTHWDNREVPNIQPPFSYLAKAHGNDCFNRNSASETFGDQLSQTIWRSATEMSPVFAPLAL